MMLFDLGLNKNDLNNESIVNKKIKDIEDQFDLVMIAEKFSQSIVLLKNELCWESQDVTSFHLNGRQKDTKSQLNKTTRTLLKDYLKSDYALYNHFLKIFQSKLEMMGILKMEKEVSALEKANSEIYRACAVEETANEKLKGDQHWYGPAKLIGYKVNNFTNEECLLMSVLKYIDRIRRKKSWRRQTRFWMWRNE